MEETRDKTLLWRLYTIRIIRGALQGDKNAVREWALHLATQLAERGDEAGVTAVLRALGTEPIRWVYLMNGSAEDDRDAVDGD